MVKYLHKTILRTLSTLMKLVSLQQIQQFVNVATLKESASSKVCLCLM